jgi:hypothetical protein
MGTIHYTDDSQNRSSYGWPRMNDKAGLEAYSYSYELERQNSSSVDEQGHSDSDSGPIVLQKPDDHHAEKTNHAGPGQAITTTGQYPYMMPQQPRGAHTARNNSTGGKIYIDKDISVSVSQVSDERLDRPQPSTAGEKRDYYSYSGSGLRPGMGRQYSFSTPRTVSRERLHYEPQRSPPTIQGRVTPERADLGRDYYLRGID